MNEKTFSDGKTDLLRKNIEGLMSGFRLRHTLGAEAMAVRIGEIYCPNKVGILRAAALLHDLTKELSKEDQILICREHGYEPSREELAAPATRHSLTAAMVIPEKYAEYACDELISAVRYHTTGRENMSICEKIIYLADYIEDNREYDDCIALREEFWSRHPEKMNEKDRMVHLDRVILHSFDFTVSELLQKGRIVSLETVKARNYMVFELESLK